MTLEEIIHYRRSIRHYKEAPIDTNRVKHCLELATLAPNSSNMQLWEFYHITNPEVLKKLAVACLGQEAATTAKQMVVFVTRQDLYRKRAKMLRNVGIRQTHIMVIPLPINQCRRFSIPMHIPAIITVRPSWALRMPYTF